MNLPARDAARLPVDAGGAKRRNQRLRKRRDRDRFLRGHVDVLAQAGAQSLMMRDQGRRGAVGARVRKACGTVMRSGERSASPCSSSVPPAATRVRSSRREIRFGTILTECEIET